MDNRNHERAEGQVSLSISLSEPLKQRIAAAAKSENRAISNWFVTHVEKLLENNFSRISLNETAENSEQADGENTPLEKTKYQTAAETKKSAQKKASQTSEQHQKSRKKIITPGNISGGGSSTPTTNPYQASG